MSMLPWPGSRLYTHLWQLNQANLSRAPIEEPCAPVRATLPQ